jgi:hypothetical protein
MASGLATAGLERFPVVLNHEWQIAGLDLAIHPGMDRRVKPAGDGNGVQA